MYRFQIKALKALFEQFPWLKNYANMNQAEEVKVSRISHELLKYAPHHNVATIGLVNIDDDEIIYLLDAEGRSLAEVKQKISIIGTGGNIVSTEGETVGEALLCADPQKVVYVIRIHTGYRIKDHCSVGGYEITVYKPPKSFTLGEWVEKQRLVVNAMLQAWRADRLGDIDLSNTTKL